METLFSLEDPEKIYLHIGAPDHSLMPTDLIQSTQLFDQHTDLLNSLQYGATQGANSVRTELAKFLTREYKSKVDPENLLITSGASQSFFNIIPIFTDSNTVFLMENPTYFLAWEMLKDHGINSSRIVGITSDDNGLDVENLERFLRVQATTDNFDTDLRDGVYKVVDPIKTLTDQKDSRKKFKYFLYLVPTFSNPTGVTLSLERRLKLVDLARQYDILVVCDDVYHLLYFEDKMPPERLVSLNSSNVISNCSFSKIFSPGLRLGWIESSPFLLDQFNRSGLLNSGGCSNQLTSFIVKSILLKSENHLIKLRHEYENRKNVLLQELSNLPAQFKISQPKGGFFIWIQDTSNTINTLELLRKIQGEKVTFTPGILFSLKKSHANCLRISYGHYSSESLVKGARHLVGILAQEMMTINIPGVSFFEFNDKIMKIIVTFKNLNFFKVENLESCIFDLTLDILKRNLSRGMVSYPCLLVEFTRNDDNIVFTLDLRKRKLPIDALEMSDESKKMKLTKQEKLDVLHGLEMMNQDPLKTKIVITREIVKELTFMESVAMTLKEFCHKFMK